MNKVSIFVRNSTQSSTTKMRLKKIHFFITALILLVPTVMFAPPIPPGPGGTTPAAPIDAGIGFLIIAGASYGMHKIASRKKN